MKNYHGNVVLVTGASSRIGQAIAEYLAKDGYRVYGTSRKIDPAAVEQKKLSDNGGFLRMIRLDVLDENSVTEAVNRIIEIEGTLDIVINNAGNGIAGSIEDTSIEEAMAQFDTNFFGMLRVVRTALPVMRKRGKGLIINIGSVAGLIPIPYQAMYSGSKAAIEVVSEVLRMETAPFGIKVAIVEPGDTKTGFTGSRQYTKASMHNSAYKDRFDKAINVMIKDETNGPEPVIVAKTVSRLLGMKNPPVRVAVGFQYKLIVFLRRLIPYRLASYVISKIY